MSPGDWIALGMLVVIGGGAIGGFIYWAGGRDSELKALLKALHKQTAATEANTAELAKLSVWQSHVDGQIKALWRANDRRENRREKREGPGDGDAT